MTITTHSDYNNTHTRTTHKSDSFYNKKNVRINPSEIGYLASADRNGRLWPVEMFSVQKGLLSWPGCRLQSSIHDRATQSFITADDTNINWAGRVFFSFFFLFGYSRIVFRLVATGSCFPPCLKFALFRVCHEGDLSIVKCVIRDINNQRELCRWMGNILSTASCNILCCTRNANIQPKKVWTKTDNSKMQGTISY